MSVRVMAETWKQSSHCGTELLMLLALGDYANDNGTCWPSVNALALKCRVTVRHANRLLAALKRSGELGLQLNAGPHGTNLYAIRQAGAPEAQAGRVGAVPVAPKADVTPQKPDQETDAAYTVGIDRLIEGKTKIATISSDGTREVASAAEEMRISNLINDLERKERIANHVERRNIRHHEGMTRIAQDDVDDLVNEMMRAYESEPCVSDFDEFDVDDTYV